MIRTQSLASARAVRKSLYDSESEIKKLMSSGKTVEARELAGPVAKQASDYGVYDVAVTAYRCLCKYYQVQSPSAYYYKKYKEKLDHFTKLENQEDKVREYYLEIHSAFDRQRTITPKIIQRLRENLRIIQDYEKTKDHGPYFYYKFYCYWCLYSSLAEDITTTLAIADEAFAYFEEYKGISFEVSKFHFLNVMVDCQIQLKNWRRCHELFELQGKFEIPKEAGWNNYLINKARYQLIHGGDIDLRTANKSFADQMRMLELIEIYSQLSLGKPITDWMGLFEYQRNPTGLGIALNIARIWSARLEGNTPDDDDRLREYKKRYLKDEPRSIAIIDSILFDCNPCKTLEGHEWDSNLELMPYEVIYRLL